MALTYPLDLATFGGVLPAVEMTLTLAPNTVSDTTGGGEVIRSAMGTRLWEGRISLSQDYYVDAEEWQALLRALEGAGASFLATPLHVRDDTRSGSATLNTATATSLRVNLTTGQTIRRGQFLSFSYGSNPTRTAFHQALETVTAVSGLTPAFDVTPDVRTGWTASTAVELRQPRFKAVMVPGSARSGTIRRGFVDGGSFDFRQTLR